MDLELIKSYLEERTVDKTDEESLKLIYQCAIDVVIEALSQYHEQIKSV